MSEAEQAELEQLRAVVAGYRERELADLRAALAAAREQAEHYRAEAHRLDNTARQIAAEAQEQIAILRTQLDSHSGITNGRRVRS